MWKRLVATFRLTSELVSRCFSATDAYMERRYKMVITVFLAVMTGFVLISLAIDHRLTIVIDLAAVIHSIVKDPCSTACVLIAGGYGFSLARER